MSGDQLNLDAIEARAKAVDTWTEGVAWQRETLRALTRDVPALVAEVRRLRALEASLTEERDEYPEGFDTGRPNPLMPSRTIRDTRPVVERRLVTPWERMGDNMGDSDPT